MRSHLYIPLLLTLGAWLLAGCSAPTPAQTVERAQQELENGYGARAITMLENALKKYPDNTDLLEALCFAQLNAGDATKAGELFNDLALRSTPDYHLYAATAFKKANQPKKAIEAYSLYLLNEPNQSNPWMQLGQMYQQDGNLPEALKAYMRSHKLEPTPSLALTIAEVSREAGNNTQAVQFYQNALKQAKAKRSDSLDTSDIESASLVGLAELALANQKISEAKRHLSQLRREFPEHEAIAAIEEALKPKEEPKTKEVAKTEEPETQKTVEVAEVSKTEEQPAEVTAVTPILEEDEDSTEEVAEEVVKEAPVVKEKPKVKDPFLVALEKDSRNPRRWAELAQKKFLEGDYRWAETAYLEALRLNPMDTQYTLSYLEVVSKIKAPRDYIRECEKLIERAQGRIPELYLVTARAYRDLLKNNRNASILMQDFIKRYPNHLEIKEVREELMALPK